MNNFNSRMNEREDFRQESESLRLRFFSFKGRLSKDDYIVRFAILIGIYILLILIFFSLLAFTVHLGNHSEWEALILMTNGWILFAVLYFARLISELSLLARRFRDIGQDGWLCALTFLPGIGLFVPFVMCFISGDIGPNRYGPDPRIKKQTNGNYI